MKTKHTPGPWTVTNNFDDPSLRNVPSYYVETEEGKGICSLGFLAPGYCSNQTEADKAKATAEANAKLQAAAPEMLEALINVTKQLGFEEEEGYGRMVLDAIKKATE